MSNEPEDKRMARDYLNALNEVTDKLCRTLTLFEELSTAHNLPYDIETWWDAHKKWDKNNPKHF